MSRKIKIYIAASLNSKIAEKDGSVAWLEKIPHEEGEDYGYNEFYSSIDTTIMGFTTYAQLKSWDIPFPYPEKSNYVITRKGQVEADANVEFITTDPVEFIGKLKSSPGKDIWLVGGGEVNKLVLNAGLVDEIIIHLMPVILAGGINLIAETPEYKSLRLISSKSYSSGVVELRYSVKNED